MIGLTLKDFQQRAVDFLLANSRGTQPQIILKSPTGSGKTILLIQYIEAFLREFPDTVFVWFTVGKGDLEEQSREKMQRFSALPSGDLQDVLTSGFQPGVSYFINWETVTKKDNLALRDGERRNWHDHTIAAHRNGQTFIVIIDEEHQNHTAKATDIIASLGARCEIRVSATPKPNKTALYYEIDEIDVINEGLITRAMYINRDLPQVKAPHIESETALLLEKADAVRQQIAAAYLHENAAIRPLVLIQFPNLNDKLIAFVENKLAEMGYTYENRLVARWFSAETKQDKAQQSKKLGKINIGEIGGSDSITHPHAEPIFLLFKQALATGWDCPRAKVLVKLRENMSESFEIQTLGRLRRMPEAKHYDQDILDCSFLYTFDEHYKQAAISSGGREVQRVRLKAEPKSFQFYKEQRNRDGNFADLHRVRHDLRRFLVERFKLTDSMTKNQQILINHGFDLSETLHRRYLTGKYETLQKIAEAPEEFGQLEIPINTHTHSLDLRQFLDRLKKHTRLDYDTTRKLLSSLFLQESGRSDRLLNLSLKAFFGLMLNNREQINTLMQDFAATQYQGVLALQQESINTVSMRLPLEEIYPVDLSVLPEPFTHNVYQLYSEAMIADPLRSYPERLFERFCESHEQVKYCYKNGDSGGQYLSIVYTIGTHQQRLFYPDYIVQLADGRFWLIETKGGEKGGQSKNIDDYSEMKFNALKRFAHQHNYGFAFVRDKNDKLYFCNTEYHEEMNLEHWRHLDTLWT